MRVLIVTNGIVVSKDLRDLAAERQVTLLVSPYDTSSTAQLVLFSTPVGTMGDSTITPVRPEDTIRSARAAIAASPSRSVPVVDEDGRVLGIFAEGDLIKEPNIEVILVDHNEPSQSLEGIENYRILEVIDHHRIGTLTTTYPITFINRVVGSTSTIITGMYRELRVPIPRPIASILLCGILSDTLALKSATTTDVDREVAEYLGHITNLDIEELARDIQGVASAAAQMPPAEMIRVDMKEYSASGKRFSVSQIEVTATEEVVKRAESIREALRALRAEQGYYLSTLMVTDITILTSLLIVEAEKEFIGLLVFPKLSPGIYLLKDILSRKKQLLPNILKFVEQAAEK